MKRIADTQGLIHIYTHPVQFLRYKLVHTLLGRYDATNGQHVKWSSYYVFCTGTRNLRLLIKIQKHQDVRLIDCS